MFGVRGGPIAKFALEEHLMNPRSSSRSKAPAQWQRPLLVEMLEARQMLSVSVVRGALMIDGTSGDDTITVSRNPVSKGQLRVSVNGLLNGVDSVGLKRINISALEGNDLVLIDQTQGAITLPVNIAGGSGNDTMTGGSGPDVLQGGRGNDAIRGSAGSDVLEGGVGNDDLYGGDGRDQLNGGAGADAIFTAVLRRWRV
jgi:Ca2+-binding RTX toxin-like protein